MAQVEGLTPEELEEQGAILEEAVAAALAVVAASAAAEVLAVPAGVAPTVLAAPWVSLDDLAVMATQWLKLLDSDIMPIVRETVDDTADFVRRQIVEALPTLYGQPEDDEFDVAVPTEVPPVPDVTADLIMQDARNRLVGIGDIVWANARQQLADGIREGDSIQQLADRVRTAAAVSEPRARTIARTEVAPSSNGAAIAQARSAGVPMRKIWIETPDDRTRLTHKHEPIGAGGQIRDLDEPFDVGGFLLDFPGDPTGPPQEVINERCAIGFLLGAGGPVVAARIRRYVRDDVGRFAETPGGGTGGADLRRTLGRLKVAELQQRAKTSGLKGLSKARKADLVEAIAAHDEAQARGVPMAAKTPVRTAPKSVGIPSRGTLSPDEIKRAKDLISRDPTIFATAQERFGRTVYAGNLSKADEDWLESVFKREPGLANYLAQQRQVARDQRDAAKKAGQSLPEYRRVTAARLKDWLSDKPIATRVTNEGALRDIVSSGRFKTSFEGSARGAGLFADLKTRRLGEEIHGIPADTPNAERPVYGYVAVNGVEPALSAGRKIEGIREREGQEDVLSAYGKIQVILKPDVRERTFVTVGDSLDEVAFKAPSPIDDPSADSISGGEFENRWGPFQDPDWTRRQYVEAQIRDGVRSEDIAEVVFADQPSAPTVAALEAAGIPWQVLKPGGEHVPVTASQSARRTTAPKPRAPRVSPLETAARRRQATIDKARARGDVLADVEAWLLTGADVSRVARTIDAAAETRGVDRDRSVAAVLRAVATGDRRKVRASLGRAYKALKLERIGPDDDSTVVRFDPSQHELIDGPGARPAARPGVELVRPGFATTVGGERVVLSKAIVEETDQPTEEVPLSRPDASPDLLAEIEFAAQQIDYIEEQSREPRDTVARVVHKQTIKAITDQDQADYQRAEAKLAELRTEGTVAAARLLDLLIERDGAPWGGSNPDMPTHPPMTAERRGKAQEMISSLRQEYVRNDRRTIDNNQSLRSGTPSVAAKSWRTRMKTMAESQEMLEDTVVYRAATFRPETIMRLRPGTVLTDPGVMSTDESRSTARMYSDSRSNERPGHIPVMFSIKVPAGTPAFDAGVGEYVFPPGMSLRIVKTERTGSGVEVSAGLIPEVKP